MAHVHWATHKVQGYKLVLLVYSKLGVSFLLLKICTATNFNTAPFVQQALVGLVTPIFKHFPLAELLFSFLTQQLAGTSYYRGSDTQVF